MISFKPDTELDVICLGRLGVDLNCNDINVPMEEVKSFSPTVGGSPANIAIGMAKQDIRVGFIGRTSNDSLGQFVINTLEKYDICTKWVLKDSCNNCLAITEIKSPSDCGSILYRDNVADLNLTYADVCEGYIKSAKMLMISGTALSKSPSREATILAVDYANKHDTIVATDIDYRPFSWNCQEDASLYCTMICEKSDIIFGTKEEFDVVMHLWNKNNLDDNYIANHFLSKKTKVVIIKQGKDGSTIYTKDGQKIVCPIAPADVKKTFGAGDAYASSFISALIKGNKLEKAGLNASAAASIVISGYTCSDISPTTEQLNAYLHKHNLNI